MTSSHPAAGLLAITETAQATASDPEHLILGKRQCRRRQNARPQAPGAAIVAGRHAARAYSLSYLYEGCRRRDGATGCSTTLPNGRLPMMIRSTQSSQSSLRRRPRLTI